MNWEHRRKQYKPKRQMDQAARRKEMLEEQKERRKRIFNIHRGIISEDTEELQTQSHSSYQIKLSDHNPVDTVQDCVNGYQKQNGQPKTQMAPRCKSSFEYQIMTAEELEDDIPDNLVEAWQMVICPKGKRCLIVAARGITRIYSRKGRSLAQFSSLLPGGGYRPGCHKDSCVLDGIYDKFEDRLFILDILFWQGLNVLDNEFEFRSYWLMCKFMELSNPMMIQPGHEKPMVPLPRIPATRDSLTHNISNLDYKPEGVVFYHNHSIYETGLSPLALWIPLHKIPAVLGVELSLPNYSDEIDYDGDSTMVTSHDEVDSA
eukprot:gene9864-2056_t